MTAQASQTTELNLDGRTVTLRIRHNPRARRMILKIDHTSGEVHITAPTKKSMKDAPGYAIKEQGWIRSRLEQLPERQRFHDGAIIPLHGLATTLHHDPERRRGVWHDPDLATLGVSGDIDFMSRRVTDWLRREARTHLIEAVQGLTRALDLPLPKVTIRDTSSRWGSCSSSGALSFSWRLILAPPQILTYVASHETAHLKHLNHSKSFWALVETLDPDYRAAEAWMKKNAADLFRYG